MIDGRVAVVSAVNEERLARKKMVMGFPRKSIARCDANWPVVRPEEIELRRRGLPLGPLPGRNTSSSADGRFRRQRGPRSRTLFFSVGSSV